MDRKLEDDLSRNQRWWLEKGMLVGEKVRSASSSFTKALGSPHRFHKTNRTRRGAVLETDEVATKKYNLEQI